MKKFNGHFFTWAGIIATVAIQLIVIGIWIGGISQKVELLQAQLNRVENNLNSHMNMR